MAQPDVLLCGGEVEIIVVFIDVIVVGKRCSLIVAVFVLNVRRWGMLYFHGWDLHVREQITRVGEMYRGRP